MVDFQSVPVLQCNPGHTSSKPGLRSQPDQAWASRVDVKVSEAARRPAGDRDSVHAQVMYGLEQAQSRPGRVDFKLSVAHSPAGPSDSESGTQGGHWHGQLESSLSAAKSCLGESSAAP